MATSDKPTTNGEYYDPVTRQWYVMCGADAVPIRKVDKDGKDVVPEKETAVCATQLSHAPLTAVSPAIGQIKT